MKIKLAILSILCRIATMERQTSQPTKKGTVMFTSMTIIQASTLSKFKRGTLLARSLKLQDRMLSAAHDALSAGQTKGARILLERWKLERASYKLAIKMQGGLI